MWFAALVGCGVEVFSFTLSDTIDGVVPGKDEVIEPELMSLDELVDLDGVVQDALAEIGVEPNVLSHLTLTGLRFALVDPEEGRLDFLESVEVWISNDELGDVKIASEEALPLDQTELAIDVADVNLAPYVLGEGLRVSTFVFGRPPAEDTLVRTFLTVEVGVTAGGIWSQVTGR